VQPFRTEQAYAVVVQACDSAKRRAIGVKRQNDENITRTIRDIASSDQEFDARAMIESHVCEIVTLSQRLWLLPKTSAACFRRPSWHNWRFAAAHRPPP
jgi:hypothetical protein